MKKTALITGSSGLIGSELVREFLSEGYMVHGFDLRENPHLRSPDFHFHACDLSRENLIIRSFKSIKKLDVLINNAAVARPNAEPLEKFDMQKWHKLMAVDLTAHVLMSKLAIPLLKKTKGNIINISSTRHLMSEPNTELYSVAKGGIDAFTRALSISYAHQIRVNSISPGWIADPKEKRKPNDHKQHPAGRIGRPADIAKMAVYLASEAAGFITGQDFVVDGGMTVKMIYT